MKIRDLLALGDSAAVLARGATAAAAFLLLPWPSPASAGTPSPADWRDLSIYQIVTDRFFNGDPSNDAVEGYLDPGDGARNHGGDWAGIERKLDYIAALGAGAIWISPVQTNAYAAYHGYHIQDFHAFAPHFGGAADLTSLIDAAHARGIYVILDVIANHGGDLIDSGDAGFPSFRNPGTYALRWRDNANRAAAPFDDLSRYHNNGAIENWVDPDQILGELFGLDDFRTEDPSVRADLIEAHQWLIRETDADGFRIDTVKHVELDFWQEFAPEIHAFAADSLGKSDFFLFGEIFDGSATYNGRYTGTKAGGPFTLDAVLWYPMYFASREVFRTGAPTQWLSYVLADSTEYDPWAVGRNVNFLDNHDNGRFEGFGSAAARDDAKLRLALTWQHTSLGIPAVYYGTEQEFDGGGDPWNREDMWDGQWDFGPSDGDNFDMTTPVFRHVRRLGEARAALPALRRGTQEDIASDGSGAGLYAYYRRLSGETTVLVVLNTAASARTLGFDPDFPAGTLVDALSGRTVDVPGAGAIALQLGGLTGAIFAPSVVPAAPWVVETWPPHDQPLRSAGGEIRIAFDRPMDTASVEAALSLETPFAFTAHWRDEVLALRPTVPLVPGARYRVAIGGTATAAGAPPATPLGAEFSFEFEVASPLAGFTVPSGYTVHAIPNDDLVDPLAVTLGPAGTRYAGRLLLADAGPRRVVDLNHGGFVEARVVDDVLGRPASLAVDVPGGVFQGDLLLADSNALRRVRSDGLAAGRVEMLASLPASALDWIVAIDPSGALGGDAFVGRPGSGTLWRVDAAGQRTAELSGLAGVNGLAALTGGPFGAGICLLEGDGSVGRVEPGGTLVPIASHPLLVGATSLAVDPTGAFGGALYTAKPATGEILRIEPNGAVSAFAGGFAGFPGGSAIAFDRFGYLAIVENDGSTRRVLTLVADNSDSAVTEIPVVPRAAGITFVGPNPFRRVTRIDFLIPDDGVGAVPVRLSIHDVAGRQVALVRNDRQLPGPGQAEWDGRDDAGHSVVPGVYFARLSIGPREFSGKLVKAP